MANTTIAPITPQAPQLRKQDYPNGLDKEGTDKIFTLLNPFFSQVSNALTGSISIGNLNGEVISFQVTTPASPWLPITYQSPWATYSGGVGYEPASYYVDATGRVWLRGVITSGASTVTPASAVIGGNALICQLPVPVAANVSGSVLASLPSLQWGAWGGVANVGLRVDIGNSAYYGGGTGIYTNLNVATIIGSALAAPQTLALSLDGISYLSAAPGALSCFPKQVRLVSPQQPIDVWVTAIQDTNNISLAPGTSVPAIGPGSCAWQRINTTNGVNTIQINNIPGLALNRTYNIRCWVLYSAGTGAAGSGAGVGTATVSGN
jgi:hypothetical protein